VVSHPVPPVKAESTEATHLTRLSGLALASGGVITTAAWVFHAIVDPGRSGYAETWWLPLNLALSCGAILMAMGLIVGIAGPTFFLGIVGTSVVTWRAGVYPRPIAGALGLTAVLALLTRPALLPGGLALILSALFTAVMAGLGFALIRASSAERGP
jgi:hypothetical protein